MNTVNIPKSVVGSKEKAQQYAVALKDLMRRHGFRKTRFAVKITDDNRINVEMTDGSEAAKTFFGGFSEGMKSMEATLRPVLSKQQKEIRDLKKQVEKLADRVTETENDKPTLQSGFAIDLGAIFTTTEYIGADRRN